MRPAGARGPRGRVLRAALLGAAVALPCAATPAPAADGARGRVVVLLSQPGGPYQEALDGFRKHLAQHAPRVTVEVRELGAGPAAGQEAALRPGAGSIDLFLTLGSAATRAAGKQKGGPPIVAGLVLTAGEIAAVPDATGVALEFPVETELRFLQRLLPGQKNVGVLYHADNQERIRAAEKAAPGLGLALNARQLDSPRDLPDALEAIARQADVLWGVPDPVVLTPQTAKPILLFSFRNRIPFVGLSQTWARAGAIYALDRDYQDIGAQCAEQALRILQGAAPRSIPPASPRTVLYSINLRTARHLKLEIPGSVLKGAREVIE